MEERRVGQDRKLDTIISELAEIKTSIAVYASDVAELKKTAKENKDAIKGNGKAGLETRMALTEEREQKRDRREWFIYTVLAIEIIALIFSYIKPI